MIVKQILKFVQQINYFQHIGIARKKYNERHCLVTVVDLGKETSFGLQFTTYMICIQNFMVFSLTNL